MKSFQELYDKHAHELECLVNDREKSRLLIEQFKVEKEHATKKMAEMEANHFRIHGEMSEKNHELRIALEGVVRHCLPNTPPPKMMGLDGPWRLAANVLYALPTGGVAPNV